MAVAPVESLRVVVFLACTLVVAPAHSASCGAGSVEVEADDDDAVALVCDAVQEVLMLLQTCGVFQRRPLRVDIVQQIQQDNELHYLGFYDHRAERVVVLEFDRCIAKIGSGSRFGVPMTRALYRSLLIHEIAHAIVDQNQSASRLDRAAHEYTAYAIQFSIMDEALRKQIQTSFPYVAPIEDSELSELYLDLSPPDFAIKAYLHFGMPVNGCDYLRGLLRGERTLPSGLE